MVRLERIQLVRVERITVFSMGQDLAKVSKFWVGSEVVGIGWEVKALAKQGHLHEASTSQVPTYLKVPKMFTQLLF